MWSVSKIMFCLCVDDFGVKYFHKEDVEYLLQSLAKHYDLSTDWSGKNFCGLTLDWHYDQNFVDISMPKYIDKVLHKFQHNPPTKPQYSPYETMPYIPMKRGDRQYAAKPDTSSPLLPKDITTVQSIVGSLLYYARAIDNTLLPALNSIAAQQSKPTENTMKKCRRVLDYVATFPNVFVRFYASDMILNIDSDAAYLVEPGAKSRVAGFFQLGSEDKHNPFLNGGTISRM